MDLFAVQGKHGQVTVGLNILGGIACPLIAILLAEDMACGHVPSLAVSQARRGTRGGGNKSAPPEAKTMA